MRPETLGRNGRTAEKDHQANPKNLKIDHCLITSHSYQLTWDMSQ